LSVFSAWAFRIALYSRLVARLGVSSYAYAHASTTLAPEAAASGRAKATASADRGEPSTPIRMVVMGSPCERIWFITDAR
jgi:hypothetical protein